MYHYEAFQRAITSELFFPELLQATESSEAISIRYGAVSTKGIEKPIKKMPFFQSNAQYCWVTVPAVARFLISEGKRIVIDPDPKADEASVRIFVLETCFRALLQQQGLSVFEGCAIKKNDAAVLFLMPPSFGKSTFSTLFFRQGYTVLTDDICAVDQNHHLYPSYPAIYPWLRICQQLKIASDLLIPTINKQRIVLNNQFDKNALPIKLIYQVDYHKEDRLILRETSASEGVMTMQLTLPRWHYSMNELGLLLAENFIAIEEDLLKRIGCRAYV